MGFYCNKECNLILGDACPNNFSVYASSSAPAQSANYMPSNLISANRLKNNLSNSSQHPSLHLHTHRICHNDSFTSKRCHKEGTQWLNLSFAHNAIKNTALLFVKRGSLGLNVTSVAVFSTQTISLW